MPSVSSLTVTGYKSIRALRDFHLTSLNVLIGANGSGKSNFIGLFRLLNAMYEQQLAHYVDKQGGPDAFLHCGRKTTQQLHAEFYFGANGYKFWLEPTADNRLSFKRETSWFRGVYSPRKSEEVTLGQHHSESKLKEATDPYSPYVRQAVSRWRVYHFHDTSETALVKGRHAVNDNLLLKSDAANLAPYLRRLSQRYPREYRQILETIRLVAPFFGDFVHRTDEDYVELEWTQRGQADTPFKAHLLSDGTLRFICLVTLLLQPMSLLPDTILIDEPELGLHPFAISVLADIFKQVAEQRQLIVSTQSVELVNELSPKDVIVVDLEEGASSFRRYTEDELAGWLSEYAMGELWKRNILGGRP